MTAGGYRPVFPSSPTGLGSVWEYLQRLHDDLYPRTGSFSPGLSGVTENPGPAPIAAADVTALELRQGRFWQVSVVLAGGSISTPGAYLDLSFPVFAETVFMVKAGSSLLPALVAANSNRLFLPTWTEAGNVTIFGVGGE